MDYQCIGHGTMAKSLIQTFKETKYRMTMRQAMQKSSLEELHICLEECRKEIERRNRK